MGSGAVWCRMNLPFFHMLGSLVLTMGTREAIMGVSHTQKSFASVRGERERILKWKKYLGRDRPDMSEPQKDFFISYTGRDSKWAEWIAWCLEQAGYSVIIQAWDFPAGSNARLRDG